MGNLRRFDERIERHSRVCRQIIIIIITTSLTIWSGPCRSRTRRKITVVDDKKKKKNWNTPPTRNNSETLLHFHLGDICKRNCRFTPPISSLCLSLQPTYCFSSSSFTAFPLFAVKLTHSSSQVTRMKGGRTL